MLQTSLEVCDLFLEGFVVGRWRCHRVHRRRMQLEKGTTRALATFPHLDEYPSRRMQLYTCIVVVRLKVGRSSRVAYSYLIHFPYSILAAS
jgi:hypothetical protein